MSVTYGHSAQRLRQMITQNSSYFRKLMFVSADEDLEQVLQRWIKEYPDQEFGWSFDWNEDFILALCYQGWLPMAHSFSTDMYHMFPKLHIARSILSFNRLHVPHSARKKAKRFRLTMNASPDRCVLECVQQHGAGWLCPPLVAVLRKFFRYNDTLPSPAAAAITSNSPPSLQAGADRLTVMQQYVRFHSFEVWDNTTQKLVAGEIGYQVGAVYTSMSGFNKGGSTSAGTVQLLSLGVFLYRVGFAVWDLGMPMPYKRELGATEVPRLQFLALITQHRQRTDCFPLPLTSSASTLTSSAAAALGGAGAVNVSSTAASSTVTTPNATATTTSSTTTIAITGASPASIFGTPGKDTTNNNRSSCYDATLMKQVGVNCFELLRDFVNSTVVVEPSAAVATIATGNEGGKNTKKNAKKRAKAKQKKGGSEQTVTTTTTTTTTTTGAADNHDDDDLGVVSDLGCVASSCSAILPTANIAAMSKNQQKKLAKMALKESYKQSKRLVASSSSNSSAAGVDCLSPPNTTHTSSLDSMGNTSVP